MNSKLKSAELQDIVDKKLERISKGYQLRVLDLFAGCGGMTLGFQLAGCKPIGGVEIDPHAAASYALNFHSEIKGRTFQYLSHPRDITATSPDQLLHELGFDIPANTVDILIGGPPCPSFARVGRAKLREVHEHPEAFRHDPRSKLYLPYLDYVERLRPLAILMENVPDIMNFGGHNLADEICEVLDELGYSCSYTLLNAASYGVPQMRERFFLVGIHSTVRRSFKFPFPTRFVNFPRGYQGSRQVALKHVIQNGLFNTSRYVPSPVAPPSLDGPVTVEQAIGDLPPIFGHLNGEIKRGARKFDNPVKYREDVQPSEYARLMRCWPGFESNGYVCDHVIRSLSNRDYRLFRAMSPGDDYPKAHKLAMTLFEQKLENLAKSGEPIETGSPEYDALKAQYVPPYDPGKFPNKWRKMEPDQPARTLMAHLGKDSYSHIHYDSKQARVISVREAARLQSFPDNFHFEGTMNPAYRQVGNAVPPLLSFALSRQILHVLFSFVGKSNIHELQSKE